MHRIGKYCFILVLALSMTACYEDITGCTDIEAKNYNVAADTECTNDCCTYPSLILSIYQARDTFSFRLGDTLTNNLGQQIKVLDYVYTLSDFALTVDTEPVSITDSLSYLSGVDTLKARNDIIAINRNVASYTIGELRSSGLVSALSFQLGIPSGIDGNQIIENGTPLTSTADSLYNSTTHELTSQRWLLARGTDFSDTLLINIPAVVGNQSFAIELDTVMARGFDKTIDLRIDYQHLFDDIDMEDGVMDTTDMKQLQTNLLNGITQ